MSTLESVWIAETGEYEDAEIIGVYASAEAVTAAFDQIEPDRRREYNNDAKSVNMRLYRTPPERVLNPGQIRWDDYTATRHEVIR